MKKNTFQRGNLPGMDVRGEKGSAIVIALLMLALISIFVALAISRSSAEAAATGNETAEARTFYAAQGSLETMTRNFNKIFERKLNPTDTDLNGVRNGTVAGLDATFNFFQEIDLLPQPQPDGTFGPSRNTTLTGGPYTGLIAIQDNWRLRTTATNNNGDYNNPIGTQVELTRNVLNNRIPIFQFGIFYNDDLELFRPPRFSFGGRVHSNGNFFISPGAEGVFFDSRVTAADQIVTQSWRNWDRVDIANSQTFIKNASGDFVQLAPTMGSVLNTSEGSGNNIFQFPPAVPLPAQTPNLDLPPSRLNNSFLSQSSVFDGNLQANVPALRLPLNVGANTDLIEMVKRGKELASATGGDLFNNAGTLAPVAAASIDNPILRSERFANKTGIRISLADSQAKLPGCASGIGINPVAASQKCGVRLDGRYDGLSGEPTAAPTPLPSPSPSNFHHLVRGYQPKPMKKLASQADFTTDPYRTTRLNGERFYTGGCTQPTVVCREVWIKVETVQTDEATQAIITRDITEDFLSLGVTEPAVQIMQGTTLKFQITDTRYDPVGPLGSVYDNDGLIDPTPINPTTPQTPSRFDIDNRSVIRLQRFVIAGQPIPTPAATPTATPFRYATYVPPNTSTTLINTAYNPGFTIVQRYAVMTQALAANGCRETALPASLLPCPPVINQEAGLERTQGTPETTYIESVGGHVKLATVNSTGALPVTTVGIVPFPIKMFDAREGLYFDERSTAFYSNLARLPRNGVMSMIDIDIANLRRFLRGDFDGTFPVDTQFAISRGGAGLRAEDIPQQGGWVLYVSDRRGDADFDGEYDMEDIYGISPGNDNNLQLGEDTNRNGTLERKFMNATDDFTLTGCAGGGTDCEAPRYSDSWLPDFAAVVDHKYYRRGVRLVNGETLPGIYNATTPSFTRGFTVASENGIYVQGNYNATGAAAPPAGGGNTPFDGYLPQNGPLHIPASVVSDGVTILSNAWNDGQSFRSTTVTPFDQSTRLASTTQMRFAMISGDTIASREATPNQGGISPRLNGGVHNFKRFLERWTGQRLDYAGSLINLFNSRNNNGSFKCCSEVYNPPIRNWVFDSTFLDPNRLPPGTPFFQYVQTTGFQRTNN